MNKIIFTIIFIFTNLNYFSQVLINEYSCANKSITDNFGSTPDWVELFNKGTASVSIGGYFMSDVTTNNLKWPIPAGTTIAAGGFLRIWLSGKDTLVGANLHAGLKLSQCKPDVIIFANASGAILDSVNLKRNQASHSWARVPDGTSSWKVFTGPTPNATNGIGGFANYALKANASQGPGFYPATISIGLSTTEPAATIWYTTNGSLPVAAAPSIQYTAPITISATTIVRVLVVSSNPQVISSFIETNTYFIAETFTIPVISICGDQLLTLLNGSQISTATTLEYFDQNKNFVYETSGSTNKHGNDSWAFNQRGIDFKSDDELGYNYTNPYQFFADAKLGYSARTEFDDIILKAAASDNYPGDSDPSCHMRDAFVQSYAFRKNLELDGRRTRQIIVFANGQYWGIYELREKFDTDYTDFYYDQPKGEIDNLQYWGGINVQDGSDTGWVNIYNYIMTNNMGAVSNYSYVNSKLSIKSLIDYMIYNTYVVNSDFINWNSAWWRGRNPNGNHKKWRYWMWDMDNVYNLGENFSGIPTTSWNSNPCDYATTFPPSSGAYQGHAAMLSKLINENDTVRSQYINRYAGLINTALQCDSIEEHRQYYLSFLSPEMPKHIAKWGGTLTQWQQRCNFMDSMITMRCTYVDSAIKNCYSVTPYPLNIDVLPAGAGWVNVASIVPSYYPWTGTYFASVYMNFNAIPATNYVFDYWSFQNRPIPGGNASSDTLVNYTFDTTEFVVAHFKPIGTNATSGTLLVPTAFSPNGDGLNDLLFAYGTLNSTSLEFEIYNRWGQKVFATTDKNKGWDGTFSGAQCQVGVYAYLVKAVIDGKSIETHGNITLIR